MWETEQTNQAKENLTFHQTLMQGLFSLFQEASKDGLLKQAEDLIDTLWSAIPTKDKLSIKVLDEDRKTKISAIDAWDKASTIKPPCIHAYWVKRGETVQMTPNDYDMHYAHKQRTTRKTQIWTDLIGELGFLYKRTPYGLMATDPNDNEWAESDTDGSDDAGTTEV